MLILLAIQAFLEVIILPLGRKISMISNSSTLKGSSSSHKGPLPSSKRKSIVEEREVVKYTKQMPLLRTNLPTMTNIKPLVLLLLQAWLLLFLLSIFSLLSVRVANSKPELSQLFFISIRQRELVKSSRWIWSIYLYRFYLVCALVSHTTM